MVPRVPALLVLLLVGAGCVGGPAATPTESPSATASPTATPTATATDSTATGSTATDATGTSDVGTDCPYVLTAEVASESQLNRTDDRVAFENLSSARRSEFEDAVAAGEVELGDGLPERWGGPVLVEYEGEVYHVVAHVC